MDEFDNEYIDISRDEVVSAIKSNISKMKTAVVAEFIMRLIESIDDEVPYSNLIDTCESLRFELL